MTHWHCFLSQRDEGGVITWEEFEDYYTDISFIMDSDAEFEAMLNDMWGLEDKQKYILFLLPFIVVIPFRLMSSTSV